MSALPARDAYALWARSYDEETALSRLDELAVSRLTPALEGRRLLDAACGTGRRLAPRPSGARLAVGIDLSLAMLAEGRRRRPALPVAAADLLALPFAAGAFDVVWCRLAVGHVRDLAAAYRELARVADRGGTLLVSDLHPLAARAGHTRRFRAGGAEHEVEHHAHEVEAHEAAAHRVGLSPVARLDVPPSEEVADAYRRAGRMEAFERDRDLPVLLVLRFERGGARRETVARRGP